MNGLHLILVMIAAPVILWFVGYHGLAGFAGIYVLFSIPSFVEVIKLRKKEGEWPKVSGFGITLAGRRFGR